MFTGESLLQTVRVGAYAVFIPLSIPKLSFSKKYSKTAIPTAAREKKNCRIDSPKNMVSL